MTQRLLTAALLSLATMGMAACGSITSMPLAGSTGTPACPVTQQPPPTPMTFCLNAAERADHESVVHDPTIPDSAFIKSDYTLTISPADTPKITAAKADKTALSTVGTSTYKIRSTTLAELHDLRGNPTRGHLVWIIDVTSPQPSLPIGHSSQGPRSRSTIVQASPGLSSPTRMPNNTPTPAVVYVWIEVDATSGALMGVVG